MNISEALTAARGEIMKGLKALDALRVANDAALGKIYNWCVEASSPQDAAMPARAQRQDRSVSYTLSSADGRFTGTLTFEATETAIAVKRSVTVLGREAESDRFVQNLQASTLMLPQVHELIVDFLTHLSRVAPGPRPGELGYDAA